MRLRGHGAMRMIGPAGVSGWYEPTTTENDPPKIVRSVPIKSYYWKENRKIENRSY